MRPWVSGRSLVDDAGGIAPAAPEGADRPATPVDDRPQVTAVPALGAPVTLIPALHGGALPGVLTAWSPDPSGTRATGRVRTSPGAASALRGAPLWLRTRTERDDAIMLFAAMGSPATARTLDVDPALALALEPADPRRDLDLIGVTALATETRRTALRAPLARRVLLVRPNVPSRGTHTIDLSTAGCRVPLPDGPPLAPGDRLDVALDLTGGTTVWGRAEVVRVDLDSPPAGQAGLRFVDLAEPDGERLERDVLGWYGP